MIFLIDIIVVSSQIVKVISTICQSKIINLSLGVLNVKIIIRKTLIKNELENIFAKIYKYFVMRHK